MLFFLPLGEDERAHDGDEDQERGEFERIDEFLEEHRRDLPGGARNERLRGRGHAGVLFIGEGGERRGQRERERKAGEFGEFRKVRVLFFAGVQKHDDEEEEDHDRAAVDDDLDHGDKFGAHEEIKSGEANHDDDKRKGAVNRMALPHETKGAEDGESGKDPENEEGGVHFAPRTRSRPAVTMRLAMETGSKSFQPTFMSWS